MNPERPILEKLGKRVGLGGAALLALGQIACAKTEPTRAQAPTQPQQTTSKEVALPTATPTPEPKQNPTATATKEPTATTKSPETESPFPKYGVWEGEFFDGTQTSYMVTTTPLDEKMGALMTYLPGMIKCSDGKTNYGFGFISVDRETFLKPGVKRGKAGDSFDATYNPQQNSISGRLIIPPNPVCDAQNMPFKLNFVGYGPDTFMKAAVESYRKAGLYTDSTRVTMVKEHITKYIGELPPQASR